MPYRRIYIVGADDQTETLWCRVPDEALFAWLAERGYLRSKGYPDRPPDIDSPTIRLWIERPSEEKLLYFRSRAHAAAVVGSFPVYTVAWHARDGSGAKVLVTGFADGSLLSRVVLEDPSGVRTVDKAHLYPPDDDPADVWDKVMTIVGFVALSGPWRDAPLVTDYLDFLALDAEIDAAEADAEAAGLMEGRRADA